MPETQKQESAAVSPSPVRLPAKRAPTLYVIIGFKILKGLAFVGLAVVVYCISDNDLPAEYRDLLRWLRVNPERKFWSDLAVRVGNLSERTVLQAALATVIYSLFSLVEGVGLMFRVSWAGWLAIGESAFFIPIEVLDLIHGFNPAVAGILVVNIFILWYLYQNRERLFRHHH